METVLITGASQGIGRAIAERLSDDGFAIVNFDLAPTAETLPGERFVRVDLADPDDTARALRVVIGEASITRLVNNVGTVRPATLADTKPEDLAATISLNVRCAMQCAQALLPAMQSSGFGRIVSIASRAAIGLRERTAYAAAKAGLIGMTKVWAIELASHGITANAVAPTGVATALWEKLNPPGSAKREAYLSKLPMQRLATSADVAHAVAFFLDERSSYITGQVLYVCGGQTIGQPV